MTYLTMPRDVRDELCRKLRVTASERGQDSLKNAVMIGQYKADMVSNIPYITCPTVSIETLGCVDYKTARQFEDA